MREAYRKKFNDWGYHHWQKVELTGIYKQVHGGPYDERTFYQIQHRIFGIPVWKSWVREDDIKFFDKETATIHRCDSEGRSLS